MNEKQIDTVKIFDREYNIDYLYSHVDREVREAPFSPKYVGTVTMCVHISSHCNLACKYCFNKKRNDNAKQPSMSDICRFTDIVTQIYPNADRYIVDMSGDGEPLLNTELVFKIAEHCKSMSDKFVREFLPTLVTNGTLLSAELAEKLQSAGVLFGISLDGTQRTHDRNRVYKSGKGSYADIERNIKNIKAKEYVGAAVTYTDGDLSEAYLNAVKLLPTVSMKPVRATADSPLNANEICNGYDELVRFLLDKTLKGEAEYIFSLVNGDDYFGKFLKRTALGINVYGRCDAGVGRFALASDGNIYCCPAAVGIDDGHVGDLDNGIRLSKIDRMWKAQRNDGCNGCFARNVCGGECKIVSYNKYGNFGGIDKTMCEIKRHLCLLSRYFVDILKEKNEKEYDRLMNVCRKTESYYDRDERLIEAVKRSDGKYTFTLLKRIKNADAQKFNAIYAEIMRN